MRWYTSDHHFGHIRINELCNRPFSSVEDMNETMIANWNSRLEDDDEIWVIGDFAMGGYEKTLQSCVSRLRGRIVLVPGNHDRCWLGMKFKDVTREEILEDYRNIGGVAEIIDEPENHIIAGESVRINHFPYRIPKRALKYEPYRPVDDGSWLLHGHVHEKWRQRGKQINLSVDVWGFAPVSEDEIAEIITKTP